MDEPRIYPRHVRAAGFCSPGGLRILARFNVDPQVFAAEGVPVSATKGIVNPLVRKAASLAVQEWELSRHGKG